MNHSTVVAEARRLVDDLLVDASVECREIVLAVVPSAIADQARRLLAREDAHRAELGLPPPAEPSTVDTGPPPPI